MRVRSSVAVGSALVSLLTAASAFAQGDIAGQVPIAGEWAPRITEDQLHRLPGPELGDYTGLPINAAARRKAAAWDASILSRPERMTQPHPAVYSMRGPGPQMRITRRHHPVTHQLVAYTLEGMYGRADRVIWMDGRPHPSATTEHQWEGFSTGVVEGNRLTVTTTHNKWGVIQRNGVATSPKAVMTEHFIRHGEHLTVVTLVDDPIYLEEPFIRTQSFVQTSNAVPDERWIFEAVDEVAGHPAGYVPHYPVGTRHDEFAKRHGLPFEATQGGKITVYPEYELRIRELLRAAQGSQSSR
jgi:hypothetical protein